MLQVSGDEVSEAAFEHMSEVVEPTKATEKEPIERRDREKEGSPHRNERLRGFEEGGNSQQ